MALLICSANSAGRKQSSVAARPRTVVRDQREDEVWTNKWRCVRAAVLHLG